MLKFIHDLHLSKYRRNPNPIEARMSAKIQKYQPNRIILKCFSHTGSPQMIGFWVIATKAFKR